MGTYIFLFFFFQAEDGIRDTDRSRGLGDVYKRQDYSGISVLADSLGDTETKEKYARFADAYEFYFDPAP